MRATRYSDRPALKHAFIKALHARFRREGIVIPYPVRTLELKGGYLPGSASPTP